MPQMLQLVSTASGQPHCDFTFLYPPSPTTVVKSTLVVGKALRRAGRLKVSRIWSDMLGFSRMGREAVETAEESAFWWSTSLKRGVNERGLGDFTAGNFLSLKCFELL